MEKIPLDIHEQILVRLDAGDLIRCKSVCRSWHRLITSNRFIKAHLNNNDSETGNRRVVMTARRLLDTNGMFSPLERKFEIDDSFHIVGSCNGLVCIISTFDNGILVANPSTGEVRKLRNPQIQIFDLILMSGRSHPLGHLYDEDYGLCWGFGYDSSIDDYKVVLGFFSYCYPTGFLVLTLKSNVWKIIGEVKYWLPDDHRASTLCNGALHWYADDENTRKVILSFDLSREEFKEIPRPECADGINDKLGSFKGRPCTLPSVHTHDLWVLKNDNV